ncbi:hypothetical protein RYH80_06485 [Halobaculum sp. MBLA0147]|uniref:hypothetical protein n=1 Tax=Halobaculum sp. MBLA0147 TaxID=3079934 RepID=UPI003524E10F
MSRRLLSLLVVAVVIIGSVGAVAVDGNVAEASVPAGGGGSAVVGGGEPPGDPVDRSRRADVGTGVGWVSTPHYVREPT